MHFPVAFNLNWLVYDTFEWKTKFMLHVNDLWNIHFMTAGIFCEAGFIKCLQSNTLERLYSNLFLKIDYRSTEK